MFGNQGTTDPPLRHWRKALAWRGSHQSDNTSAQTCPRVKSGETALSPKSDSVKSRLHWSNPKVWGVCYAMWAAGGSPASYSAPACASSPSLLQPGCQPATCVEYSGHLICLLPGSWSIKRTAGYRHQALTDHLSHFPLTPFTGVNMCRVSITLKGKYPETPADQLWSCSCRFFLVRNGQSFDHFIRVDIIDQERRKHMAQISQVGRALRNVLI